MSAAGSGCSATDTEPTAELCLACDGERRPFFVANADPFNIGVADSVCEGVKRVANQAEYVRDANLFEHVDQGTGPVCDICTSYFETLSARLSRDARHITACLSAIR
jgi:hypothetical protein